MTGALRLYLRYVGISIRGQMQYRASFVMTALGHGLITLAEFTGVLAMFDRFGQLEGWTLPEMALLYGIVNTAFALAEALARGFDTFPAMIQSGDFDRLLLRPRSLALQVMGQELQLMRVGRFAQGLFILLWASSAVDVSWSPLRVVLLLGAIIGGACAFGGLFVVQATIAFWTIQTLEVMNVLTYGGVEAAQYPLTVYRPWFRRIFTFIVPLGCASYFPALAILGRADPLGAPSVVLWVAPAAGALFLALSLLLWRVGVRHYRSTGS